jgi:hypothetical protein
VSSVLQADAMTTAPRRRARATIMLKVVEKFSSEICPSTQGCQMVSFQTKNPKLGKFWRALCRLENADKKRGYILWAFGIFDRHLGYFMTIWYILCSIGTFFPVWVISTKKNLATLLPPQFLFSAKKIPNFCSIGFDLFLTKTVKKRFVDDFVNGC